MEAETALFKANGLAVIAAYCLIVQRKEERP